MEDVIVQQNIRRDGSGGMRMRRARYVTDVVCVRLFASVGPACRGQPLAPLALRCGAVPTLRSVGGGQLHVRQAGRPRRPAAAMETARDEERKDGSDHATNWEERRRTTTSKRWSR
jgi:hypothetical protein